MFQQDYVVQMIKDLVSTLSKLFLNKDIATYELPIEESYAQTDYLHMELLRLIDQGKINEAENILYKELDGKNIRYEELAVDFYRRLNELDDEFLEKNNFSREEVEQGLKEIAKAIWNISL